jgi:hypothetical protein
MVLFRILDLGNRDLIGFWDLELIIFRYALCPMLILKGENHAYL